jgi:PAS domain S-box-containing protein
MAIPLSYDGQPAVQIIARDVTARKQVQEALDESRRFTRRIIETNPNLIYIYDLQERRHVYMTPAVSRILGFSPEDLQRLGQKDREGLLHPEDVEEVTEHLARCGQAQDGEILEIDYRLRHASGRWVVLHSRDVPFSRNPDGTARQILGSAQDVTEQRQAEEALRASEERYRRLASNAQDVIYRLRLQPVPRFEYVSPAAKSVLGYTPEECCGEDNFIVRTTHPDDLGQLGEYLAGKIPFSKPFVVRVQRKDKRWVQLEVRNTPIHDEGGQMIALEGIARDISDRQRAEEAMLERTSLRELSHRILQSQEEERRRLSRELHDEAGQALTAIKLNTELLAKRVPDNLPALKRLAQDTSEVTAGLISEMRRIAAALRPAVLDDLGLLPTLRWYAKSIEMRFGLRVKLISRGLKGRLNPSFETTIYRIVQEALTNVVRHAQAHHATVKVTYGKGGLHLLVQDDGKGMDLGRIRKGTGLTGIRERAHLYAGTMALESQPDEGTTLQVKFRNIPEVGS